MRAPALRLALLLLGAGALTGLADAPAPSARLLPDAEARWIDFTLTPGNQPLFTASLNGVPARAILDTGVTASVASPEFAARAGLKVRRGGAARAIGGDIGYGIAAVGALGVGGLRRIGGTVTVAPLPATATGTAEGLDLLIGADLLHRFALDIDFPARRFRLLPSGRLPFRGAVAPLALARGSPVYLTAVTLAGYKLWPLVIDTGDGAALTLSRPAFRRLTLPGVRFTTTIAYGLGGAQPSELAIVPHVALGAATLGETELRIEPEGGFAQRLGVSGRIGTGLLDQHRVLLDPGAGRLVIAPATDPRPPPRSTSGLLLRREGALLRVLHVMRGGPAEAGGWRAGETICAVDGAPIDERYQGERAAWPAGAPGRRVALGLCDGGERVLTLERFY